MAVAEENAVDVVVSLDNINNGKVTLLSVIIIAWGLLPWRRPFVSSLRACCGQKKINYSAATFYQPRIPD